MVVSNNRKEILSELNKHNSGKIILSPSVETGYDFKGDMCRWQIIAKIPYAYMGDPFISLNMKRSPRWYSREAILRLVQACGRAVRGVDDSAVTYVIDENVKRLIRENHDIFPDWFLDSVIVR
jgi:Rad3-related DNA helicase